MTEERRTSRPIATAPKDGTVIEAKNDAMDGWVQVRWDWWRSDFNRNLRSQEWVLVKDSTDIMPLHPGTLVIPDVWRPLCPLNTPNP